MIDDNNFSTTSHIWEDGPDAFPDTDASLTGDRRTEARLCAMQALFAVAGGTDPVEVRQQFTAQLKSRKADRQLFDTIFDEATDTHTEAAKRYHELTAAHLHETWPIERVDPVIKALFWAAGAELAANTKAPTRAVLNEFINISKGFCSPKDVAFINAALDGIAKKLRPE